MKRFTVALLSLLSVLLLGGVCVGPLQAQPVAGGPTPTSPDTLQTGDVEQDNGFTIVQSSGQPFTGIVADAYESGAKKLRRSVVDGLPEGLWMEWYESGVPRYQATWRRGRGHGLWTYYHENGEIRERVVVVEDVYDGLVEGWHRNGRKAFEGRYRKGNKDGRWRRWDATGTLSRIEVFRDGTMLYEEDL